jgi:hypothetical protein
MARYLFIARYASDGIGGIVSAGRTARRTAIETMAASVGGRVESFDFAFGGDDLYTVLQLPDNKASRRGGAGSKLQRGGQCAHGCPGDTRGDRRCRRSDGELHPAGRITPRPPSA